MGFFYPVKWDFIISILEVRKPGLKEVKQFSQLFTGSLANKWESKYLNLSCQAPEAALLTTMLNRLGLIYTTINNMHETCLQTDFPEFKKKKSFIYIQNSRFFFFYSMPWNCRPKTVEYVNISQFLSCPFHW